MLSDYQQRLANVLEMEANVPVHYDGALRFPRPSSLQLAQDAHVLNLLEFLSLYGCDLQLVVARQNASLGKMAQPSQRLLSHLQFLDATPACIQELEQEQKPQLVEALREVYQSKREQLPQVIWQAVLGGEEARLFWKVPVKLDDYPEQTGREPIQAVAQLSDWVALWLRGEYRAGWASLEHTLAELRKGDGGAQVAAWSLIHRVFSQIERDIQAWEMQQLRCIQGRPHFNLSVLDNVIQKFFVGQVQQWASSLSRRYYALIEPYIALERLLEEAEPEAYKAWRQQRGALFEQGLRALRKHVQDLQHIQQACQAERL
ncbi:MAG: DUF3080 family protein [Oleiphilaceae bacterium]|nr:DUF3080 family protein [Oleiphilaceae bacterium]